MLLSIRALLSIHPLSEFNVILKVCAVGNDELEDAYDTTEFENQELSESLDESKILRVSTEENAKFCADSASLRDGTCKLRGPASFACKDASKFHQDSCQTMGQGLHRELDAESVLGAADDKTSRPISQKISAVLSPYSNDYFVKLDANSLKASIGTNVDNLPPPETKIGQTTLKWFKNDWQSPKHAWKKTTNESSPTQTTSNRFQGGEYGNQSCSRGESREWN